MIRYSKDRKIHETVKTRIEKGWHFKWGAKHGKLISADGRIMLPVPGSPSDHRSAKNFERDIRCAIRRIAMNPTYSLHVPESLDNFTARSLASSCN